MSPLVPCRFLRGGVCLWAQIRGMQGSARIFFRAERGVGTKPACHSGGLCWGISDVELQVVFSLLSTSRLGSYEARVRIDRGHYGQPVAYRLPRPFISAAGRPQIVPRRFSGCFFPRNFRRRLVSQRIVVCRGFPCTKILFNRRLMLATIDSSGKCEI